MRERETPKNSPDRDRRLSLDILVESIQNNELELLQLIEAVIVLENNCEASRRHRSKNRSYS